MSTKFATDIIELKKIESYRKFSSIDSNSPEMCQYNEKYNEEITVTDSNDDTTKKFCCFCNIS